MVDGGGSGGAEGIAPGSVVLVRDEEWRVRSVRRLDGGTRRIEATGVTELVRDQDAVFFDDLEQSIEVLDPRDCDLVPDDSPAYRRSRLWLESLLRQSPAPLTTTDIISGHRALADQMDYQLRPAAQALENLRPRVLIGDAVGLGKTVEIGITLTELIERGRGERILVVTPRAVLEQFQRELWTRFAIPLVRLDSDGIQKVRQTLPATRNPFSYYRRAIVSIDTLKNPARYRHHLKNQSWDAVVIDECHNLINRGTQNNELARLLAQQTDALILASATPHNGKPESFAELLGLLDPTAIADPTDYRAEDIEHLYVRRHRNSPDVSREVGHMWAQRREPRVLSVAPTDTERAVLDELRDTWLHPPSGDSPTTGRGRTLFPWTLLKAFLSSPDALRASVDRRLRTIADRADSDRTDSDRTDPDRTDPDRAGPDRSGIADEQRALERLDDLAAAAQQDGPSKLDALVEHLREIGVSASGDTRVVVFSERIDTLHWLYEQLQRRLKLPDKAMAMLHAQLPDHQVQQIRTDFELTSSKLRVLLASDMASEGINLHRQCHRLVHYDLPWSFIRIQQRNGRIDRYQQQREPEITALALTVGDPTTDSDLRVVTKLLQKEHAANQALGDAGALLDLHDEGIEEETVMDFLAHGRDLDDAVPEPEPEQLNPFAALMATGGEHAADAPVPTARPSRLFEDDDNFLTELLEEITSDAEDLRVHREQETGMLAFDTPKDLQARLTSLPASYLDEQNVLNRIRLTAHPGLATQRLDRARRDGDSLWPDVGYLARIHPVLEWATSRALTRFQRNQAPVLAADVEAPVFLTQASWANQHGQPVLTRWGSVAGLPGDPRVEEMADVVVRAGLRERARNPGGVAGWLPEIQPLVPKAVEAAEDDLRQRREEMEDELQERLGRYHEHLSGWKQLALTVAERSNSPRKRGRDVELVADHTSQLIDGLAPSGQLPFVRVIAVLVPTKRASAGR